MLIVVSILGWGTTEFGGPVSTKLQKVSLNVVNPSKCEAAYPDSITSGHICTFTQNKDTCSYDSGWKIVSFSLFLCIQAIFIKLDNFRSI